MPFHYSSPFSEDSLIVNNRNIVQSWKVCAKSSHTTLWKVRFKSLEDYISIVLQIFLCSIFPFSRKVHCIFSRCKITVYRFSQQKNKTNRTIIRPYCYVFAAVFLHFHKMSLNLISLSRNFANAISIFIQRKTYALRCSPTAYFPFALGLWKTTRRLRKNNTSFWWKQHVILMKTTRRFCANDPSFFSSQETRSLSRSWPLSFFKGTPLTHKTSPHKHIFLSFSRKSYHKIWSIAKNTINLPHKVCRIIYWKPPFALNLEV